MICQRLDTYNGNKSYTLFTLSDNQLFELYHLCLDVHRLRYELDLKPETSPSRFENEWKNGFFILQEGYLTLIRLQSVLWSSLEMTLSNSSIFSSIIKMSRLFLSPQKKILIVLTGTSRVFSLHFIVNIFVLYQI